MLQITIKTRLLSIYLQMTQNFIPVLITLKMLKLCKIVLTLCCNGQKSEQLTLSVGKCKILVLGNAKFSNVYNLGGTPLPNVNHITDLGLLWITNLHLNCI